MRPIAVTAIATAVALVACAASADVSAPGAPALASTPVSGPPHAGLFDLPPLLQFSNGSAVSTPAQWEARRAEMRALLSEHYYGSFPATTPKVLSATVANRTDERGYSAWFADVVFDTPPTHAAPDGAHVVVEIIVPSGAANGSPDTLPPLFMTQSNHRRWALVGVSRGYVACVYPGADSDDQTDGFRYAYPEATWGLIARRAWLASRVLDYVLTLGISDPAKVAITGHSRNGKQSMIAAAYDERFTAVISSSSGVPAMSPYRFTSAYTFSEGPASGWPAPPDNLNCSCPRNNSTDHRPQDPRCCWWPLSIMKYDGRENTVPIDSHALLGLIAPRHFASECAWTDPCDPSFAVEKSYVAGREVYRWLGVPERLRIQWRPGQHHGFESPHDYFDWFDLSFGRATASLDEFPEVLLHDFNWTTWNATVGGAVPPAPQATAPLAERLAWALGDGPPGPVWSPGGEYGLDAHAYVDDMLGLGPDQLSTGSSGVTRMAVNLGQYIYGSIYYADADNDTAAAASAFATDPAHRTSASGAASGGGTCTTKVPSPRPAVIWLHPWSYQGGYVENYARDSMRVPDALAKAGYTVLAFDQVGFATRLMEGVPNFYRRHPNWSMLGKMVHDVTNAVDMILANQTGAGPLHPDGLPVADWYNGCLFPSPVDNKVVVAGYGLGAMVALHAASMDPRISGVAALAGITPFRNDTMSLTIGGNRRLFGVHGVLPRLGLLQRASTDVARSETVAPYADWPYDYDDLLIAAAERGAPTLVYAPTGDRVSDPAALAQLIAHARSARPGGLPKLTFDTPDGVSMMNDAATKALVDWLKTAVDQR